MSTHDAQFLKETSAERRSDGGWTLATPATAWRYLALVLSGVSAGLLYPVAIGWLFGAVPGPALLAAAAAFGGGLGVVVAVLLGSGRPPER